MPKHYIFLLVDCQQDYFQPSVTGHPAGNRRFTDQERALSGLERQLHDGQKALQDHPSRAHMIWQWEAYRAAERDSSVQLAVRLQEVCKGALSATRAKRTGQRFGDIKVEGSRAFQGIVGAAKGGVEESFGTWMATRGGGCGERDMGRWRLCFYDLFSCFSATQWTEKEIYILVNE